MLRRFWKRIEPWLSRAGHVDLVFVQTGLGSLIVTGLSGVGTGILAWWHQAPAYQVILAAMFGMGAALFIANQSLRLIISWKAPFRFRANRRDAWTGQTRKGSRLVAVLR
jgi:hypothetical protein